MYHQHSQQQGSQPFPNGPRPPHHQPPPNQHQNRSNMQVMGFQFPRPTQLPDELESALAIRGGRDMDHRQIEHMNRPNQHQNQGSGSGINQHGSYGSNPMPLPVDNQAGHQQGVDWSSYQPPTKLFANPPPSTSHQSQQHQGPQQQPQSSQAGPRLPTWTPPVSDSTPSQARPTHGGGGDSQSLYTPESAGSILASFGLSNEDLEVLSHYPDDQLTPDTLPFILRDIQINKSGNQKTVPSTSSTSFSRSIHDMSLHPASSSPLTRSRSPEVPSLLTVTQTAGKVIDYGHASRANDETSSRETFKREPLSSERTVKMYPASPSSSSAPKADKIERRQVHLEPTNQSKHGDRDYRRTTSDQHKSSRSPGREFPPSPKSRNLDRDYRRDGSKPRPSSETRSEASSRRSLSSSSGSKAHSSSKKLPTPTMISDCSAVSPKVYPHTCSLCHIQCDEEKDWVDHINTVNHTAACRDLRNKFPDWKPNPSSRRIQYGSWAPRDPKDRSLSHSVSRSVSRSPSPNHRVDPHPHRPHGRPYSPHRHPRHHYPERRQPFEHHHSGPHSPSHSHRVSSFSREYWAERRDRKGGFPRSGVKRPHDDLPRSSAVTSQHPSSSTAGHGSKHGHSQPPSKSLKGTIKPGTKTTKTLAKPPVAKKKKKVAPPASQDLSVADRLVYLTGIPKDATEQEVTDLVGSFGKINNVILMPCSEEESESGQGQKASVCMVKAEDAHALAASANLSIREQPITASVAKKPEAVPSDANNSKPAPAQDKGTAGNDTGGDVEQKTSEEKGVVLISGLPESGWSESDIIQLFQPFGIPSDIILATQIKKVLVSVSDMEVAQEIVKVHSFTPAKIQECEVKMTLVKQRISLSTPVSLYNLLMGPVDPLESPAPVGWSSLLVISNVPDTPSGSSEVQKLVRRFGTVIKTLVLNSMVICEMATAAMSLSVYKRFQTFPCIIQSNPLFFSRKPDPKPSTQTKVIAAYLDSTEETPPNGKGSQTAAAADEEETVHEETSESAVEGMEKDGDAKDENLNSTEKTTEDEALGENGKKDDKINEELAVSDSAAADTKPETDLVTEERETSAAETVTEAVEENRGVDASEAGSDAAAAGEETTPTASQETAMPELPKMTQAMVNALLVECRTRTGSLPNSTAAPPGGEQRDTQVKAEEGKKAAEEAKEAPKNHTEEEVKKRERERKEREARNEKEGRERERRERERRAWEKEERIKRERFEKARRERERREEERREWERRERERRERKRSYGESLSGSRSYKQSSWREERHEEANTMEEESDEFPFNMSDFVTVDEVGDVTDLPSAPSPTVPTETLEGGEDATTSVQEDTGGDAPMEAPQHTAESEHVSAPTADSVVLSDVTPGLVPTASASPPQPPQAEPSSSQTCVPPCQPEAPETGITAEPDTTPAATLDSTVEVEPVSTAAPEAAAHPSTNSPAAGGVERAESEEEKKKEDTPLNHSQAKKEEEEEEGQGKMQDEENKETRDAAAETGKHESSEDHTNTVEESVETKSKVEAPMRTDSSLPPFDPSNPVGMEFLVPKTGFFCKVCSRFFSGAKEAEINHCKTLKHYENLQKYLQTTKTTGVAPKPASS